MFMEKEEEITPEKGQSDAVTVYEISYLILPSLDQTKVDQNVATLKSLVEAQGGVHVSDESPVFIDLAYSITKVVGVTRHKSTTGYFGWMKFELSQTMIENVKKALDASETVMRYLIIKTVRENTLLNGKMNLKKEDKSRKDNLLDTDSLDALPENEEVSTVEEIDKSIDNLVVV